MGRWFDHRQDSFDLSIRVYLSEDQTIDNSDLRLIDYTHHSPVDGYPSLPFENIILSPNWAHDSVYVIFVLNEDKRISEDYHFNNINHQGLAMNESCNATIITNKISNQINTLYLYPNPADNVFSIEIIKEHTLISISNISGEIITEKKLQLGLNQIDVSHLSKGIYITRITNKNEILQSRLIKL